MSLLLLGPSATMIAAAGTQSAVVASIQTLNRLFVNTSAGAASFQDLSTGLDGQLLWILNRGANPLTLLNGVGVTGSEFSGVGDLTIPANDSMLIFYDGVLDNWIMGI